MRPSLVLTGIACILAIVLYTVSCRRDNGGATTADPAHAVSISNFSFSSANLQISAGSTVTWTNNDNTTHTVTADDASFTSGDLAHGSTFSHTFTSAVVFHYHCKYHSMMKAVVTVQ
ncbi:cupredoxin domain-containing protein [Flavitalea flava]